MSRWAPRSIAVFYLLAILVGPLIVVFYRTFEPGLQPGKEGTFEADLEPLCPEGEPDEWVAFASLGEQELAKP